MLTATSAFVEAIEKWVRAMKSTDYTGARIQAEILKDHGDLLAIRPEFRQRFARRNPDLDAETALMHLSEFMLCATECRVDLIERSAH